MLKNLRIEVDAHTHTVMSGHAWSTIQENCAAAAHYPKAQALKVAGCLFV